MMCRMLHRDKLTAWLEELSRSERRLIAPQREGDDAVFKPVETVDDITLDYVNIGFLFNNIPCVCKTL